MAEAAAFLTSKNSEVVIVLSPHTPRYRTAYGVAEGSCVEGHFGAFGRPDLHADFTSDTALQQRIKQIGHELGVEIRAVPPDNLDHGALVPLFFLKEAGYTGAVVVIGFPAESDKTNNTIMGETLRRAASEHGKKWALLASGDMSHRLAPGAPAGFHPQAERFDRLVLKCVESGEYGSISSLDPNLRDIAAEDIVDSLEIARAALQGDSLGRKVLSYEGPFGVGYLVAILRNPE
jgi:aromatic ring-opening dioxygenase LigB subunit